MSAEDRERIASLEANQQTFKELVTEMRDDIREMRADFSRARGLVAGAVLAVSAIWGIAVGIWQFIRHKVT